ncbi:GATA zinc finger domain-containing protein 14-like [Salvia divinorum]|uniref:GATA zinc finger domain-containing protein 14-like n=1 Tax=Salvia divinorum TaxID=28513 RepID=A0ABD1FK38_SALDI
MNPHFNPHLHNPNNQIQLNGANAPAQHQVMGNQGNLGQINPQFRPGMLNNAQPPMPPFNNPNPFFAQNQFIPFPQGAFHNLNANNLPLPFSQNAINPAQFMPNWPMNVPNFVQNVTQLLQMQMMNGAPLNLGLFMNAQSAAGSNNVALPQPVGGNSLPGMNHNNAPTKDIGAHHAQRNWDVFAPGAANPQSDAGVVNDVNDRKSNWRKPHENNFTGNHKRNESQRGFGNKQFHPRQNAQGNFNFNNENRGKGNKNFVGKNFKLSSHSEQTQVEKKRPLMLNYTEQEIKHWREERKKNYPSQANAEKKLKRNPKQPEVEDEAAKTRRQQLKEILAKQAELGCEVAEIPSCYLSDPEQQADGNKKNNKPFGKRDRFQNKFDKKARFQNGGRFSKKQRYENGDLQNQTGGATNPPHRETKKEPSLLKKLLSSEIKKDKKHLLQVFRFMVVNNFFENWPETPLEFPKVIVRESGDESEILKPKTDMIEADYDLNKITDI